jgi:hypothetical protein
MIFLILLSLKLVVVAGAGGALSTIEVPLEAKAKKELDQFFLLSFCVRR